MPSTLFLSQSREKEQQRLAYHLVKVGGASEMLSQVIGGFEPVWIQLQGYRRHEEVKFPERR